MPRICKCTFNSETRLMNSHVNPNNLLIDIQDSDFGDSEEEDLNRNSICNGNKNYSFSNLKQSHKDIELTSILNSFTNQSSSIVNNDYDFQSKDGPPPIINLLAENYRIKLTEKLSNCNSHQNGLVKQFNKNQVIPILYLTPHIPQNKRHVHFIPDRYDTVPPNATVFDFNAAMIEHNEKITERQELAIAYAEMLCSDVSLPTSSSSSRISPCFKYSTQRLAPKIAFDRTPQPKNSRPTLPARQNTKKKIKIYQLKEQNERSNFSDCCRESFYAQNCSYGQNSLNDALSIFKVNVPNTRTIQLSNSNFQQQQRKQNSKKNPSLSKPQRFRNSNRNNKIGNTGCLERENSSNRVKRIRGPLQIISPNNFDSSNIDFENQNRSYNKFNEELY